MNNNPIVWVVSEIYTEESRSLVRGRCILYWPIYSRHRHFLKPITLCIVINVYDGKNMENHVYYHERYTAGTDVLKFKNFLST